MTSRDPFSSHRAPIKRLRRVPPLLAACLLSYGAAAAEPTAAGEVAEPTPAADLSAPPVVEGPTAPAAADAAMRQQLESELSQALATPAAPQANPAATSRSGPLSLIDLSFDLLGVGGTSTADENELPSLEAGGHDPKNRGFTVQNVELTFSGVVDPYLRGDANIVLLIDETGETLIELEEAYLTSLDLPGNLQLKAGQFFTAFGRLNPVHPHAWDFVDQPVVNSRFFGPDGLRSPGVQLSWLTPLPFFAELVLSVQNAHGETLTSFGSVAGETLAGRSLGEREVQSLADLLYLTRLRTSVDASEAVTLVSGISALFGPNTSGSQTRTQILGADLYLKWRPLLNDHGWPFAAWQTEAIYRSYEAGPVLDLDLLPVAAPTTLADVGVYSQVLWGFARPWVVGARYDYARGEPEAFELAESSYGSPGDALRDERQRYSAMLTYYPSEFSKLRLQYNYDRAQFLGEGSAHSAYLQFEILFGAHGAHRF
jgi:hypothetical protein